MKTILTVSALLAFFRGNLFAAETIPLRAAASDRVSARPEIVITTLGFGSCARQNRPQPIWDTIHAARCDAFVLIPQKPEPKEGSPKEPEPKQATPAVPKKPQLNRYRLHDRPYTGSNFGLMRVKWDGLNPALRLEVCGLEGEVVLSRDIPFSELRPK